MVPSVLVPLDALPLTPNGKVDRAALPAPEALDAEPPQGEVAPRDETEAELAKLWEEVLGRKAVGVTTDFFDAGGNSLLAMSLLARVERRFDARLSLPTFFEAPTIEALAASLRDGTWAEPETQVFPMRRTGTRPPLLLVDAGPFHRPLVRSLGDDQPIYGVALPRLSDLPEDFTVQDVAANLVRALDASPVQPPYRLAGWSHAGVIAYEVARQLRAQGREVALVVLFDTNSPTYLRGFRAWWKLPVRLYLRAAKWRYYLRKVRGMPWRQAWRAFRERMQGFQLKTLESAPLADGELSLMFSWQMQYRAAADYDPQPCDWPLVLFRSAALQTGWFLDPELGWGKLARAGLSVLEMPGEHDAMFREPDVRRCAALLNACLEEAEVAVDLPTGQPPDVQGDACDRAKP
jgi:thioesterase domain-containing protein